MRKRILTNYIIILILSALITGALAFYFIENSYTESKEEKLITNIALIENALRENYKDAEKVNFYRVAQDLSLRINSRVTFIDVNGWPIADSINNSILFNNHSSSQEFRNAMKGDRIIVKRYSPETGKKYFYLAIPPIKVGNIEVILRLGDSYDDVDHIAEEFLSYLIVATCIGVFLAILMSYVSVGKIVKPIKELTKASRLISEGEFDNKIIVDTNDEIQELSVSFNQMADKLKYTINQLKETNTELDTILSSIKDGIIALDLNNRITLVNESVNKILDIDRKIEIGQNIKKAFGNLEYIKEIEEGINNATDFYTEVTIGTGKTKFISLSTYPIRDKYQSQIKIGLLLIIRDITSIVNLEKMRKDFVANVSHELRTPLTSIGGFVETLRIKELGEKSKEKALDIIEFETERLKGLINELLILSKIESIIEVKKLTRVQIKDDIYEVLKLLEPQIKDSKIGIELKIEDNLNSIKGDKDLFRRILINLFENSIKYNNPGGSINIHVSNYEEGIELIVEDSGIGIPEEDIPWIFERFYRVDKSRSNNKEGTGLGLAIVKHIVLYFGGTIELSSKLGIGSRFIVKLPK